MISNIIINQDQMSQIFSLVVDIGMATGPVLGYIYQYRLIKLTESVGSFSIDICGILIFANVLRLNFYLFDRFETALVFQSIFMIIMQVFLLYICAKFNPRNIQIDMASQTNEQSQGNFNEEQPASPPTELFWRWQKFRPFALTIIILLVSSFTISVFFRYVLQFMIYGQLVGLVALVSQSILITPQIIKNIRMGTTKGLSKMLVFLNLTGDILKLIYFLLKSQPFQFILCGIIQVFLDSFVVVQIVYYKMEEKKQLRKSRKMTPIKKNKWAYEYDSTQSGKDEDNSATIQLASSDQSDLELKVQKKSFKEYNEEGQLPDINNDNAQNTIPQIPDLEKSPTKTIKDSSPLKEKDSSTLKKKENDSKQNIPKKSKVDIEEQIEYSNESNSNEQKYNNYSARKQSVNTLRNSEQDED